MLAVLLFSSLIAVSTEAASRSNAERFASCPERSKKRPVEVEWSGLDAGDAVEVWKSSILQVVNLDKFEN